MIEKYSIDILKPKWPKWKKAIANFFLFNLKVLHIRPVNRLMKKHSALKDGEFIQAVINDIGIPYEIHGSENIPSTGAVTLVANHPGGADVVTTIAALWDVRHDFEILANELICVKPVIDIVIPVNVMKKKSKVDLNVIDQAYQQGKLVTFFAAGKNSRITEDNELKDRRWRTSFLDYAFKHRTPLVVFKINTENTPFFYKISNFREKTPKLKNVPLENMFQLREIMKQKGRKIDMYASVCITFEEWSTEYEVGNTKKNRLLADKLYDFVYTMDNKNLQWKK